MKLYIYEHCPFCSRARLAFGLKGIAHDTVVVMEGDADTPMRLIGRKAVPILEKPDGTHMGESLDIVRYVDGIGRPMFGGAPEAALDAWGEAAWKPALELFIPRFTLGDFAELATPAARQAYRSREERAFGDLDALLRDSAPRIIAMNARLGELAGLLEGRGEGIGISDIKLWPILRSLSIVEDLRFPPAVRSYMARNEQAGKVPLLFDQVR